MEQSKLTSEWIQTFNRLGSEGKLKPTVPYHDLFNRKRVKRISVTYITYVDCKFSQQAILHVVIL